MQFRSFAITIDRDLSTEEVQLKINPVVSVVHDYDRIRVILNIKRSVKTAQTIKDLFLTGFNQYPNIVVMVKMIDDGPEDNVPDTVETPEERNLRVSSYIQTPEDIRIQEFIRKNSQMEIPITTIRDVIGFQKIKPVEEKES